MPAAPDASGVASGTSAPRMAALEAKADVTAPSAHTRSAPAAGEPTPAMAVAAAARVP